MRPQLGLDLSPVSLRACLLGSQNGFLDLPFSPAPKGCPASLAYDSRATWGDPMAFRSRHLGESFSTGGFTCDRTVDLLEPSLTSPEWISEYRNRLEAAPGVPRPCRTIAVIPNLLPASLRDGILRTIGADGVLLWRPVAAALTWLSDKRDRSKELCGRQLWVLDLDGGSPELTALRLVNHERRPDELVPVREHPRNAKQPDGKDFTLNCQYFVLNGFPETPQLARGQFAADFQRVLESDAPFFDAWIRRGAAWRRARVDLAAKMPIPPMDYLSRRLLAVGAKDANPIVLCVGWFARRYSQPFTHYLANLLGGEVDILPAQALARGAAEFGARLEQGLPTYYDQLPNYQLRDNGAWKSLFDQAQRVEPGKTYHYPANGSHQMTIARYNDNVSLYVQLDSEATSIRRLKTHLAFEQAAPVQVSLSATITPEKGSARFSLSADAPLFQNGASRVTTVALNYSDDSSGSSRLGAERILEHVGYLEPQPILGRIYDSPDNLKMVLAYVDAPRATQTQELINAYLRTCNGIAQSPLSSRFGYSRNEDYCQPSRGLFGTKRIPDSNIDRASRRFAECEYERYLANPIEQAKRQNYCFGWATSAYRHQIRAMLKKGEPSDDWNRYYAAGYVLGDQPDDLRLLLDYHNQGDFRPGVRVKLWWALFRLVCWHEEVRFREDDLPRIDRFFNSLLRDERLLMELNEANAQKNLLLAILFLLRIRAFGFELPPEIHQQARRVITKHLRNVPYPKTMVHNLVRGCHPGDNLTHYVLRFLDLEDTLDDRELGANIATMN